MTTIKISDYLKQIELGYITPIECISVFKKIAHNNKVDGTKEEVVYNLVF